MSNNASLAPVAAEGAPSAFVEQSGPTSMQVRAGPAPRTITLPFVINGITMTQNTKSVKFDRFGALPQFSMFESVRLLSASFTAIIMPGATKMLYYSIDERDAASDENMLALTGPVAGIIPGAQYGVTIVEVPLPPDHSFGRELKATSLGNDTPTVHFLYRGGTPASTTQDITIRGVVELELGGVGVVRAVAF
jgi:hypothetical protein